MAVRRSRKLPRQGSGPDWQAVAVVAAALITVAGGYLLSTRDNGSGRTPETTTVTTPSAASSSPAGPITTVAAIASTSPFSYNEIADLRYRHSDGPYPQPQPGKAIIAHGDMRPSSNLPCEVRVFRFGEEVKGLGEGSIKLIDVAGDLQRGARMAAEQADPGKPCPITKP